MGPDFLVARRKERAGSSGYSGWLGFEPDEKQAELLRRPFRRLLLNCTRQWGKSTITAAKAVEHARTRAESLTLVVSPSGRQSNEFLRKAGEFMQRLGMKLRGDGGNDMSLVFPNGSRIVRLPGSEGTVRGFSAASLIVIDEAARVPDDLYRAMRPMLAVGDGDLWLMSTPWGKRGFFWNEWSKGGEQWERVSVPATECARIPARFLAEERVSQGDRWFRQEYMCEFTEAAEAMFDLEMIERCFTDDVKPLNL